MDINSFLGGFQIVKLCRDFRSINEASHHTSLFDEKIRVATLFTRAYIIKRFTAVIYKCL